MKCEWVQGGTIAPCRIQCRNTDVHPIGRYGSITSRWCVSMKLSMGLHKGARRLSLLCMKCEWWNGDTFWLALEYPAHLVTPDILQGLNCAKG